MASTASPYGFKPVNEVGGLPYAGSTRSFVINPAGYGTNIFNGSLVYVASTGYLQLVTADGSDGTTNAFPAGTTLTGAVGVFVGKITIYSCPHTERVGIGGGEKESHLQTQGGIVHVKGPVCQILFGKIMGELSLSHPFTSTHPESRTSLTFFSIASCEALSILFTNSTICSLLFFILFVFNYFN